MKNIVITLNSETLRQAVAFAKNDSVLMLDGSLLSIKKITTILKPEVSYTPHIMPEKVVSVTFSYNDPGIAKTFTVQVILKDASCISYIESSKLLNEQQLMTIKSKIFETDSTTKYDSYSNEELMNIYDEIAFNEALAILLTAVNKEDAAQIQDEFKSNFEKWRASVEKSNAEDEIAFNELYKFILAAKIKG